MNTTFRFALLAIAMSLSLPASAHQEAMNDGQAGSAGDTIGKVNFQADCADEVRADVDHALGMMHHMMYTQARAEFGTITQTDPDCAMAHWGIATTLFQPLWGTTPSAGDITQGRQAIQKARDAAKDHRERLLINATAAFFEPDTDQVRERLAGWIEGMDKAYQAFPEDLDVATLYALSRLTLALSADDRKALHNEAEKVLRAAWETEPTHPGAVHYSIHATDADGRAANATEVVDSYTGIAPSVPHALHMPSHIYVRLGDWPRMIDWNQQSSKVAVDHKVDGATSFHYIHALDYLVYGHLQRGEDSAARDVWKAAQANGPHQANFPGAFHLASIPARLAVETRDWEAAAAITPRAVDYIDWDKFPWPEGLSWFARGLGAVHTGDLEAAREAEQRLETLAENAKSAADQRFSTYIEVDRQILTGWIANAEGEPERAIELMRSAGELEATVEKHPVTPGALLPPYEALGDLLLALDRPAEALAAYQQSNRIWPQRHNTLEGAARASDASGNTESAKL
ncbi:TPR repeat protein [Marinobacter lipolyticus SM19]|uniref:TPR repeat protein n=1 Tax=Marinobacter lipolyticus SM19 TaxID=1318628 RepID=R8AX32_9GAMM|nr:TPR repeat protein [Marinobacter lipolyticus]EON90885.1 TPR repeat protein [Marinobacter lipolyticus SM19]